MLVGKAIKKRNRVTIAVVNEKETLKKNYLKPSWILYSTGFLYCNAKLGR